MALELIAGFVVAITLGLMAWALRRWVPSLPRWLVPLAAGAGMICYSMWSEYSWFSGVSARLPAGFVVTDARAESTPMRPWTYLAPLVTRFTALDGTKIARHPNQPGMVIAPVFGFVRWQNPTNALLVFDCAKNRRVPVVAGMQIDDTGTLLGAEWTVLPAPDALQQAACSQK